MNEKKDQVKDFSIVYIYDEKCLGTIKSYGAYSSLINYHKDGIEYEINLLNEDFEIVGEVGIGHIQEEDL